MLGEARETATPRSTKNKKSFIIMGSLVRGKDFFVSLPGGLRYSRETTVAGQAV